MRDARHRSVLHRAGKYLAMLMVLLWSLGPIVLMVRASLTPERDIFAVSRNLLGRLTFENYVNLVTQWSEFLHDLVNSAIVTTGATLLVAILATLAGYGYSRWYSKALALSVFGLIALRLVPPIVLTLPLFPIVNWLRLNDTHLVLIIIYAALMVSLGTMVMRNVIDQIPRELDEAALMDGASRWQIIWRVIVPLCAQGVVAVSVFVIVYAWNEFLFAFLFTSTVAKTAPLALSEMLNELNGVQWGVVFAATTMQLLPVLVFVILAKSYLIKGITSGSVKG